MDCEDEATLMATVNELRRHHMICLLCDLAAVFMLTCDAPKAIARRLGTRKGYKIALTYGMCERCLRQAGVGKRIKAAIRAGVAAGPAARPSRGVQVFTSNTRAPR
jgi:hypothetical protein